ncbi:response regulator [Marinobacterium arenosum]|uniref:response regulator n=1 Tax=Marinobacterium arenosum TaxID=2862496 RepID=UPI001C95F244|nr:response regulator [Marinobacterium arenosum]MBY4677719.1 response regulator [Marinobacterium arenosum]
MLSIAHRLQFERGKTITYLANPTKQELQEWRKAVGLSDGFIDQVAQLKTQLSTEGTRPEVLKALGTIETELEPLYALRERLPRNGSLDRATVLAVYTRAIEKIHHNISNLLKLAPGSEIFQLADALTAIAELKEITGQERALVSAILEVGQASESEIRQLLVLTTKKEIFSQKFLKLAPLQYQEAYLQLDLENTDAEGRRLIQQILLAAPGATLNGNAKQWFTAASERIDKLREIEKSIHSSLVAYADRNRNDALNSLLLTLAIALATVGGITMTGGIATRRLVDRFVQMRNSAVGFVDSGQLEDVPIDSDDELGEVARAFNQLIDKLRTISHAMEEVARGDLEQQVPVKSDNDRLALSLNHMIRALRESVSQMQQENWLKTGQNELAVKVNSDQRPQELAQKAINQLCRYLEAPVGAIYLVDKDETAELCASYAYTFRKEVRNRFTKGESLVGQAVLERQPIIINQLPPDYVCVSSGLGSSAPSCLAVFPLIYADKLLGVLELGTLETLTETDIDLLDKASASLAVALHAACNREQLTELLEETQAQSEELQAQQEELEQTNSELEEQAQQLEESQQELRMQKQQLTEANEELRQKSEQLSIRNQEVEARSEELEKAHQNLEHKAQELATASRYKSEFLANMSHELRTPLNSLLLLAQELKENSDGNLTAEQLEAMKIIHGSGHDLLNLINDILDLSKVEAGKLSISREACDLQEVATLLQQQFKPLANERNLEFAVELAPQLPAQIHTDPQRLQQILRNLLGNAIKFTEQGRVSLKIEQTPDALLFHVNDTGIGIPAKLQQAIFEAFQQVDGSSNRKYSGTGLGLTISRELSRLLGGEILLQSEEHRGSRFSLKLPLSAVASTAGDEPNMASPIPAGEPASPAAQVEPALLEVQPEQPAAEAQQSPIAEFIPDDRQQLKSDRDRLLIIEDDLVFARCMMELAHARGFQCLVAGDAESGIAMARHYKPHAIVLDMVLPDGSGNQVIEQLKADADCQRIPIHIISSLDREDVEPDDAIGVLTKPISKESINDAFRNILHHLHDDSQCRVLVIEDDRDTRKAIDLLLQKRQVEVLHAGTGSEGLRILEREQVDCLILDLNLPDMDSLEILRIIAEDDAARSLPVIIYTGRDLDHEEYKQLRQYTDNIIIKGSLAQDRLLNDVTLFLHSVQPAHRKRRAQPVPTDDNVLRGKKVLIVDDDMRNTFALANLLRRHGMTVVMADNGSLALEKLSESKDIQFAVMDIMMPVMDGYETIRRIRERADYKDLPIIALTAKAMPEDRDRCLQVGANDYLAKPVDSERLMSALKVWASA